MSYFCLSWGLTDWKWHRGNPRTLQEREIDRCRDGKMPQNGRGRDEKEEGQKGV